MATKKLTVEVDADASKAKRKIKRDLSSAAAEASSSAAAGGAAPASSAVSSKADSLAKSLERAGKNADYFGRSAERSGSQISRMFRSLAGLGAGMAIGYAANHMQEGRAQNEVKALGSAVSGASVGSGIASALHANALISLLMTAGGAALGYDEEKKAQEKARTDFLEGFQRRNANSIRAKEWNEKFRGMTEMPAAFGAAEGLELLKAKMKAVQDNSKELSDELERLKKEEGPLEDKVRSLAGESKLTEAAEKEEDLQTLRSRIAQVEAAKHSFERQQKALQNEIDNFKNPKAHDFRTSTDGTDSLARVGADWTSSVQNGSDSKSETSAAPSNEGGRRKPWRNPSAGLSQTNSFFFQNPERPTTQLKFDYETEQRRDSEMIEQQKRMVIAERETRIVLDQIYNEIQKKRGATWL